MPPSKSARGGTVETRSGIEGFRLLRLNGSAFKGFVRDEYTTLPDIANRPLHMWLDLDWTYTGPAASTPAGAVRAIVYDTFARFESGSIQQIIYHIGQRDACGVPAIAEVNLEANNRTWDTIARTGRSRGVYTDARPPYGCLGLYAPEIDMARISTHVLDIHKGKPAAGIAVRLYRDGRLLGSAVTKARAAPTSRC